MMSGIASGSWSLVNAALPPRIGRRFDAHAWSEAFWLVAIWPWLSRGDGEARSAQA